MNSTMDNLESLPDRELQRRLQQFGFSNIPVTPSTRNSLIRTLRKHMTSEKLKLRKDTSNVTRYSSGEESDAEVRRKINRPGSGKISSDSFIKYSAAKRSFAEEPKIDSYNNNIDLRSNKAAVTSPTNRISQYNSNISMLPPSTSVISRRLANSTIASNRSSLNSNRTPDNLNRSGAIYVSPLLYGENEDDGLDSSSGSHKSSRLSSSPKYSGGENYKFSYEKRNDSSTRSQFSPRIMLNSSPIVNGNHSADNRTFIDSPNYCYRRTENYASQGFKTSPLRSRYSTTPSDVVHQQIEPTGDMHISPSAALRNLLRKLSRQYFFKQSIPCILVSTLVIFFVLVTFMYVRISPDLANTVTERNTIYTPCPLRKPTELSKSILDCVEKDSIEESLNILKIIAPELQRRAEFNKCRNNSIPYMMSHKEVVQLLLAQNPHAAVRELLKNLYNVEYLIAKNPHWKIFNVDSNGIALELQDVIHLRETESNQYAILNPKLPFFCSLYIKFQKFFFIIGCFALLLFSIGFVFLVYRLIIRYRQSRREAVSNFVKKILSNLVKKAADGTGQNYLVVNHLRDRLIPIHKRKSLQWAWDAALKYLENTESRIRVDMEICNNEAFHVLRWIDDSVLQVPDPSMNVKVWHDRAFTEPNQIENPPTPCLKIRNMFDEISTENPNLDQMISDAVLEKVGSECKIYDIQLDKVNCFVYVRCASEKDAGIAHDKINGCWFDNRLVSVKFLRLNRYLSHFPNSKNGPMCLRPSNTKNLSMSQSNRIRPYKHLEDNDDDDEDNDDDDGFQDNN